MNPFGLSEKREMEMALHLVNQLKSKIEKVRQSSQTTSINDDDGVVDDDAEKRLILK